MHLTEGEYYELTTTYHENKGFSIEKSKFDKIFFEKKILSKVNGFVYFRFSCLTHYYAAKYATKNRSFYNFIISKKNYLNYSEEINYYSGLVRNDAELLASIQSYIVPEVEKERHKKYAFSEDGIKFKIDMTIEDIKNEFSKSERLPVVVKDELTDKTKDSEEYTPDNESYTESEYRDAFSAATHIFGNVIKNSEEIDIQIKKIALGYFMEACCIHLSLFDRYLEENIEEVTRELTNEILKYEVKEKDLTPELIDQCKIKVADHILDIIKVMAPLSMQNYILDVVGTPKLSRVIKEGYEQYSSDESEKFFYLYLYCDLKEEKWYDLLRDYIKNLKSNDLLKISYFKCWYYHYTDYFGKNNRNAENITIDIVSKLNKGADKDLVKRELGARKLKMKQVEDYEI